MRRLSLTALAAALSVVGAPVIAMAGGITGDYLETRSADVWTGPCFANSETGLAGQEAILAWRVRAGSFAGVALDGLSVVGIVKANATLGDPFGDPYPAKAVLLVDERATPRQREALVAFAREMGGDNLKTVVRTESAPIELRVRTESGHPVQAFLRAGDQVAVETRTLGEKDRHCGNEETYYPPLAPTSHAMPAASLVDRFAGDGLGVTWATHDKRNAFVGTFER